MRWTRTLLLGLIAGLVIAPHAASAQSRAETLVVVTEVGPNMLDIHAPGANRPSYQAAWNIYDRLITFGSKTLKDGSKMYDYASLKPELAESWQLAPDGMAYIAGVLCLAPSHPRLDGLAAALAAGMVATAASARVGATPLARGGVLVRILAPSAPAMQEAIHSAWATCRAWLWNLPPLLLRKI